MSVYVLFAQVDHCTESDKIKRLKHFTLHDSKAGSCGNSTAEIVVARDCVRKTHSQVTISEVLTDIRA